MLNWKETTETLNAILKTSSTACLVGPHGIGKTSFVRDYAASHGFEFVSFRLGQCSDVCDVLGRMVERDGRTSYLPPEVFPKGNKPVLLFLDEINRTSKYLLQYIFEIIEPNPVKRLGSYVLPAGSKIIAAMNPATEDYVVSAFEDKAFWSRLICLDVMPTNDEFLAFVEEGPVKQFFSSHRELINDRRAITQFSLLYKQGLGAGQNAVCKAMLGEAAAVAFTAWLADQKAPVYTLEQVLEGKFSKKLNLSDKMQIANLLRDSVAGGRNTWSAEECKNLADYFVQLDKEGFLVLKKDIEKGSPLYCNGMYENKALIKKFGNIL
jgi:hypothetical protein